MNTKKILLAIIAIVLVSFFTIYITGCNHNDDSQNVAKQLAGPPIGAEKVIGDIVIDASNRVAIASKPIEYFISDKDIELIQKANSYSKLHKVVTAYVIKDLNKNGETGSHIVFFDESITQEVENYKKFLNENGYSKN